MNRNGKRPERSLTPESTRAGRATHAPLVNDDVVAAECPISNGSAAGNLAGFSAFNLERSVEACEATVSSCDEDGGRDVKAPRSSPLRCSDCGDLMHELSNVMTGVVVNAQLLDWRLPPYSRLKRPVHEIERNAQRAHELLKSLLRRLGDSAAS
jgi:hypothetical protein